MENNNVKFNNMYYYEVIFADNESIAIRSLIPNMTIEEAENFTNDTDRMALLKKHGKVTSVTIISREEVAQFFEDMFIDNWPIAVRTSQLRKKYEKYQLNWMIEHGHSINQIISGIYDQWLEVTSTDDTSPKILYMEWEHDVGFEGEIWACFDEWKECEGKLYCVVDKTKEDK